MEAGFPSVWRTGGHRMDGAPPVHARISQESIRISQGKGLMPLTHDSVIHLLVFLLPRAPYDFPTPFVFFGPCILGGYAARCFCRPARFFTLLPFFSGRAFWVGTLSAVFAGRRHFPLCCRFFSGRAFWVGTLFWTLRYFCSGFLPLWIAVWSTPATSAGLARPQFQG